jgi:cell division septation protein DedD
MHRLAYRNFGDHEALVVNHSVNAATSGTKAGVRWYEIRNPNGTPSIYQQSTYSPDATNRWMASIAMDRSGDMAMVYSTSSSSIFPSISYTGRLVNDTLGQMPQGEATLISGSGSQTGTASRWGDYSAMTIDPSDDCTFWFTTEYIQTTGTASWRTRIGSFKFPSCGGPPPPTPTPTNTSVPPTATPTRTTTPIPPTATNTPVGPTATPTNTTVPPTATPTKTNTPTGGGTNVVVNPGFESGPSVGWTQSSSGGYQLIDHTRPHAGSYSAYLCDYNNCTDYVQQQITVPGGAHLTYWWYQTSSEGTTTAYDFLYVRLYSTGGSLLTTLRTWSNKNTRNAWSQDNLDLSAYGGQTVILRFISTNDVSLPSAYFVDDVDVH